MTDIVTDLTQAVSRIASNPIAYLINFSRIPQVELCEDKYLMWITTDAPVGLFNSVFNVHLASATDINSSISETVSQFTSRVRPCVWWIGPPYQPSDLSRYLAAQGGRLIDTIAMMACTLLLGLVLSTMDRCLHIRCKSKAPDRGIRLTAIKRRLCYQ